MAANLDNSVDGIMPVLEGACDRKQIEQALRTSEAQYRVLFEQMSVGICRAALGGRITDANPMLCRLLGYSQQELVGKTFQSLTHPDDLAADLHHYHQLLSGEADSCSFEKRYLHKNGQPVWVNLTICLVRDDQHQPLFSVGVVQDIGDRKQTTERLQRQIRREQALNRVIQAIRQSLDLNTVFSTAAADIGNLLQTDRVIITVYEADQGQWQVVGEHSLAPEAASLIGLSIADTDNPLAIQLKQQALICIDDAHDLIDPINAELVAQLPGTWLIVPLMLQGPLPWGSLALIRSRDCGPWQTDEIELVQIVADQLAIAIQQAQTLTQVRQELAERRQIETQLVHEALHDSLTGIPNRACFMDRLNQLSDQAKTQPDFTFAVLFIDLDRFKVVNDSLGHLVGDNLLIQCAKRLNAVVRESDLVARLGGDEFAVLLPHIDGMDEATHVADRIHQALSTPFDLSGREVFISASIGIASNLTGAVEAVDFLRDADTAMYQAKGGGRGRWALFNPSMYEEVRTQLTLENDLQRALERQELALYYQPIFDLQQHQLVGFEVLVRWRHPYWGMVKPSTFIHFAEETGLIMPIGQWILQAACQQLHDWQSHLPQAKNLQISVNLSVKQFADPHLIDNIDRVLAQVGLPNQHLRLEITETALIKNTAHATDVLDALRAREIQLCIDDFGTGYSSLSMVHRFPVQVLKIDRSFVNRLDEDTRGGAMVQSILGLAQTLGMTAIAEGVETEGQLSQLHRLNCPYAQGYWFAQPLPADQAEAMILTSTSVSSFRTSYGVQSTPLD